MAHSRREPNLNPWWKLYCRRFNQWLRRQFFQFDTPLRRDLYSRKRTLATKETLSGEELKLLGAINWTLGCDSVYRYTPEQAEEMSRLAREIVKGLRDKEARDANL